MVIVGYAVLSCTHTLAHSLSHSLAHSLTDTLTRSLARSLKAQAAFTARREPGTLLSFRMKARSLM